MSAHLVTRQMSHSATTEAQYYQAIVGDKHALSAYGTMTALRRDPKQMRELSEGSESQGQRHTRNLSTASVSCDSRGGRVDSVTEETSLIISLITSRTKFPYI